MNSEMAYLNEASPCSLLKGRTIRKVMGGGGGWGIFSLYEFFFSRTACAGIFFPGEFPCTNFFFRQILLFLTVKS